MTTATLSPTADTYLAEAGGTHGSSTVMAVGQIFVISSLLTRAVMRFDLSNYAGLPFTSATLQLHVDDAFLPGGAHDVYVHKLTTTGWTAAAATWTAASGTLNWTTAGGDYTATPSETGSVTTSTTVLELDLLDLVEDRSTGEIDFIIKLPEGPGYDNHYITVFSQDYGVSADRPALVLVYPNYPVVERIARTMFRRLEQVTTGNGYANTFSCERVPARGLDDLTNGKCVLAQAQEAQKVGQVDGNPCAIEWRQEFYITIFVAATDDDTTPIDTVANIAAADAEWAITHEQLTGDWAQFDNLAMDCEQVGRNITNDGTNRMIELTYAVLYRTSENDPYTVR